jgi:hypothetical protein
MHDDAWYKNFASSVAMFTSFMAIVLGLPYCGARLGFATNYSGVLRVTGLTLLVLNVAPYGRKRWFNHATALIWFGNIRLPQKRASVLYIPKSNRAYWGDLRQHSSGEGSVSFIAPALTGIAMIHGEPEYDDISETRRLDYGFWSYPLPTRSEPASSADINEAASRAKALGFAQLIVIEESSGGVQFERLRFDGTLSADSGRRRTDWCCVLREGPQR